MAQLSHVGCLLHALQAITLSATLPRLDLPVLISKQSGLDSRCSPLQGCAMTKPIRISNVSRRSLLPFVKGLAVMPCSISSQMGFWAMYITGPKTVASSAANRLAKKKACCWRYIPQCMTLAPVPLHSWDALFTCVPTTLLSCDSSQACEQCCCFSTWDQLLTPFFNCKQGPSVHLCSPCFCHRPQPNPSSSTLVAS